MSVAGVGGDTELEVNHTAGFGGDQVAHGIGVELVGFGPGEDGREALRRSDGIDFDEDQVGRECARLAHAGAAADVLGVDRPCGALPLGEGSPHGPDASEAGAVEDLGGAGALANHTASATELAIARADADKRPAATRLGDVEYLHIGCRDGGMSGPLRVLAPVTGNCCGTRADPLAYDSIEAVKPPGGASGLYSRPSGS